MINIYNNDCPGKYRIDILNNTDAPVTIEGASSYDCKTQESCIIHPGKPIQTFTCSVEKLAFLSEYFTATFDPVSAKYTFSSSKGTPITIFKTFAIRHDDPRYKRTKGSLPAGPNSHWLMTPDYLVPGKLCRFFFIFRLS